MTDSSAATRSRGFMKPWWDVLQAHDATVVFKHEMTIDTVGLRVFLKPRDVSDAIEFGQQCRVLRDALELVFLLAVVDRTAFIHGLASADLLRHRPKEEAKRILLSEGDPIGFRVNVCHPVQVGVERIIVQTAIETLMTPQDLHARDREFRNARQQLLALSVVHKKLKISLYFRDFKWLWVAQDLASILQSGPPPIEDYPFHSVLLVIDHSAIALVEEHLDTITSCLDDPHRRVQLGLLEVYEDMDTATEVAYGRILSALLSARQRHTFQAADAVEETSGIFLQVKPPGNARFIAQLCSAVMFTHSLESVTIDWTSLRARSRRQRTHLMRWIMVSLFSSQARHNIRHVTLNEFFVDQTDMDDLEALLRSQNPLSILREDYGQVSEVPRPGSQIYLPKDTPLWLDPTEALPMWRSVRLERECWAEVVVDDAYDTIHYEAVVPGYGLCHVSRRRVHSQRSVDKTEGVHGSGSRSHGIKSLTLLWLPDPYRPASPHCTGPRRFLQLVGEPLETLVVSQVDYFSQCLPSLWDACPKLERLEIWRANSRILQQIADAYESGKCHVSTLSVRQLCREYGTDDIANFCEMLGDRERLMSETLTNLTLRVDSLWNEGMTEREMTSVERMLERNTRLQFLLLGKGSDEFQARVAPLNDQLLTVPLALRVKLAFLSAVDGRSRLATEPEGRRVISELDSDVIARIFELAAKTVLRKVMLARKT